MVYVNLCVTHGTNYHYFKFMGTKQLIVPYHMDWTIRRDALGRLILLF